MNRFHKTLALAAAALAAAAIVALPAFAQSETVLPPPTYPENTITVTGYGTVTGAPDIATVDVGVDVFKTTVSEAFSEANATLQQIIDALTAIGIAPEDIQTTNLSVYSTTRFNSESSSDEPGYNVTNTVHVIVRDVTQVEDVIDAAINAGASTLYGLNFAIQDRSALETRARAAAMQDAAARASEYASLVNAELSDVIVVVETQLGGGVPLANFYGRSGDTAQSAVVAPGQTDVQIQVNVTYRLSR
ncbi:MAG: SIMPL domain-containing protein [Chloroflexota bacterium]